MKYVPFCFIAILVLGGAAAIGQVVTTGGSTAGGDYARGMSGVIAAQGQRNLSNSQAAINLTDARSNQIDNQVKSVNAYWEKKGIYDEHQAVENKEIERQRNEYMATHRLQSLTPEEFDRASGQINWLKVLEQKPYDQYRTALDTLFKKRSYQGFLSGDEYLAATTASKQWRALLSTQNKEYPAGILSQMIRFILKLDRELDENLS
ncbi:MAG TPA: hypothetical protein VGM76_05770 [Lacipirellulaceae bacterium]|jgi:hypothetical protein